MIKANLSILVRQAEKHGRALALTLAALALALAAISCGTLNRPVVLLPNVPGAKYIGSKECEQCHDELYRDFATADHARLIAPGPNSLNAGCEGCHGPCSLHSDSGGDTLPPFTFTAGRSQTGSYGARLAAAPARSTETMCYQCHPDVRGQFSLPDHHPAPEGKLECTDCHSPHKGSIHQGGGTSILSENEMCLRCHPAQRGPFVFEHEALREGCTICHNAHGSVNSKLLTVRDANLCLRCHIIQQTSTGLLIGGVVHTYQAREGTCWTAGCHEAVHGSNVSPALQF
jgi:predicted CXXCH cytochrome family protein